MDALRAVAALSVLAMHCIWLGGLDHLPAFLHAWFYSGWLGVDLFLVISGYVITQTLLNHNPKFTRPKRNFWRNRFYRIYPLYLFTSLFFLIAVNSAALTGGHGVFQTLTHLTMTHGIFPTAAGAINGVSWTLSLEAQLYLLAFALFVGGLDLKKMLLACAVIMAISVSYRLAIYSHFHEAGSIVTTSHWITQVFGAADGFVLGALIARLGQSEKPKAWMQANAMRLLFAGLIATIALVTLLQQHVADYWDTWHFPVLYRSAIAIAFAAVLAGVVFLPRKYARLCPKALSFLGVISYGIYLWHLPFLIIFQRNGLDPYQLSAAVLVSSVLVAWLSYILIERPFNRYAHSRMR